MRKTMDGNKKVIGRLTIADIAEALAALVGTAIIFTILFLYA